MRRLVSVVPRKVLESALAVLHCVSQSVGCTYGVVMESSAVTEVAMVVFVLGAMAVH